jgi:hypothetical protein
METTIIGTKKGLNIFENEVAKRLKLGGGGSIAFADNISVAN